MDDLTGFQRDIMFIVASLSDPHGLGIKESLEEYYPKEIHHGRLYPNLDTLIEKGLLTKREKDRRTNEYALTRRGKRVIQDRMDWQQEKLPEELE